MAYSIFTAGVAGIVVGKIKRDRKEAIDYYCVMVKLPTVYKTQLDRMILELTDLSK